LLRRDHLLVELLLLLLAKASAHWSEASARRASGAVGHALHSKRGRSRAGRRARRGKSCGRRYSRLLSLRDGRIRLVVPARERAFNPLKARLRCARRSRAARARQSARVEVWLRQVLEVGHLPLQCDQLLTQQVELLVRRMLPFRCKHGGASTRWLIREMSSRARCSLVRVVHGGRSRHLHRELKVAVQGPEFLLPTPPGGSSSSNGVGGRRCSRCGSGHPANLLGQKSALGLTQGEMT